MRRNGNRWKYAYLGGRARDLQPADVPARGEDGDVVKRGLVYIFVVAVSWGLR